MKTWVWLAVLFAILFVALFMLRSRETFSGCQYSAMMANTSLSGCSLGCKTFTTLQEAQTACSAEATCGGITQRGGQMVFELRAGPATAPSTTGESSWVCSNTVAPPTEPVQATPMSGTPEAIPPPQAPATIVLPFNTSPGTYLLRPVM